ncbi:sugar ABC transporter permease [Flexivirga oryzae]|uniref:Xylose transport system permease protein XylH n=1 Tax=Flexivirga oryzae TaxID=1794944 RepID=A0A839N921_9MICO|nr:ABC transporter permease [Flexivirga oryzae]MBB2891152.1 D-xylose transport system permease protein [Flexivirga oryzae]
MTPHLSKTATAADVDAAVDETAAAATTFPAGNDVGAYLHNYWQRIRGGDMGSLPAVAALIVLFLIFSVVEDGFFSKSNFASLITQAAPGILLAMGLVFVLLLAEIDLSAGTASGVSGAVAAVLLMKDWPWPFAVLVALIVSAVIGLLIGWMRTFLRVPSFVSTLALFLGLQGVVQIVVNSANTQGNLSLQSDALVALENGNMPQWAGWVMAILMIAGFAVQKLLAVSARRRKNLPTEPAVLTAVKIGGIALLAVVFTVVLNLNRSPNAAGGTKIVEKNGQLVAEKVAGAYLGGVPWVVPVILVLVVVLGFMLNRTRYGRHIYAVGGSDEAARRAGIRVDSVRISVFVICSVLAGVSGIVLASQTAVNASQGGGNTLLLAVGAAVVGGTSLFGGKGKITDAVVGGCVVAVIINGMADLLRGANNSAWQWIVTGLVLLLAATVDAVSRRRAGASGLG